MHEVKRRAFRTRSSTVRTCDPQRRNCLSSCGSGDRQTSHCLISRLCGITPGLELFWIQCGHDHLLRPILRDCTQRLSRRRLPALRLHSKKRNHHDYHARHQCAAAAQVLTQQRPFGVRTLWQQALWNAGHSANPVRLSEGCREVLSSTTAPQQARPQAKIAAQGSSEGPRTAVSPSGS